MTIIICKKCGYEMINNYNNYGRICLNCGCFTEPEDIEIVKNNKKIQEKYAEIAINKIKDDYRKNMVKDCIDKIKDNL